jgi:hypothetical protein
MIKWSGGCSITYKSKTGSASLIYSHTLPQDLYEDLWLFLTVFEEGESLSGLELQRGMMRAASLLLLESS